MGERDPKLKLLAKVPLFSRLDRRKLERLGMLADEVDLPDGKVLMRQGETGHELIVILSGRLRVERDGKELAMCGPGDFLGEIAMVDRGPRTATVVCEGPGTFLVVGHREFNTLMDEFPDVRVEVLQALAQRVRKAEPTAIH